MPRHAGEGVSAAVEMPSRVLSPDGEGRGEDEGHDAGPDAGEESFDPGVLEQVVDEGRDEQDDEKGRQNDAQCGAERPGTPPCDAPMKVGHVDSQRAGCDSDTAMKLRNSASESQPLSRTFSRIREIMP